MIAIYAFLGTYVIAVFVLYASFSTIISYFLILKFTKVGFTCSSDYSTFLCFDLGPVPWGSDMRGSSVYTFLESYVYKS